MKKKQKPVAAVVTFKTASIRSDQKHKREKRHICGRRDGFFLRSEFSAGKVRFHRYTAYILRSQLTPVCTNKCITKYTTFCITMPLIYIEVGANTQNFCSTSYSKE